VSFLERVAILLALRLKGEPLAGSASVGFPLEGSGDLEHHMPLGARKLSALAGLLFQNNSSKGRNMAKALAIVGDDVRVYIIPAAPSALFG
jgi:hypothetical protein